MIFNKIKEKIKRKRMNVEKIEDEKLNAFLSQHRCNMCHNNCKLDRIKCGGGLKSRNEKTEEYSKNSK